MQQKISVIIPVFNGEKYLKDAIETVLAQDYPASEIIVVNDGSEDQTDTIIQSFGSQVIAITQVNQGLGAARNAGIKKSTGDFLAFLDSDDLWTKEKLKKQIAFFEKFTDHDPMVFTLTSQFICNTLSPAQQQAVMVDSRPMPGYFAGTLLLSRVRLNQIGYFFEKKMVGEFIEWYQRALEQNIPIQLMPEVTLHRRIHLNNMGRQKERYHQKQYLNILKAGLDRKRQRTEIA